MWHLSVSARSGRTGQLINVPVLLEREAVRCLRGAGNDREWWWVTPETGIGHLRVGLTLEEVEQLTPGTAMHDAGKSGPERKRTR